MFGKLNEYYNKTSFEIMAMICTYIADVGYRNVIKITDEQIETIRNEPSEELSIMTNGFMAMIMEKAREFALLLENPSELFQFCAIKGIFDLDYYAPNEFTPREERLKAICYNAIDYMLVEEHMLNGEICEYLGTDEEELERFNLM